MGNFLHHVSGSVVAGAACSAVALYVYDLTALDSLACFVLSAISGLLPDIDSQSSKPTEIVTSISSALAPALVLQALPQHILTPSLTVVAAVTSFLLVRYGARSLIGKITIHRGIFHSVPFALIWGCIIYLAFKQSTPVVQGAIASSAVIGYLVHLIIDEMFSFVNLNGMALSPKKSFGTAIKFFSESSIVNFSTYTVLFCLLYWCAKDMHIPFFR